MQIGIDLGGSHIAVGIISEKNTIVVKREKNIEKVNTSENTNFSSIKRRRSTKLCNIQNRHISSWKNKE